MKIKWSIIVAAIAIGVIACMPHAAMAAGTVTPVLASGGGSGSGFLGSIQSNLTMIVVGVFGLAVVGGVIVALFNSQQPGSFVQHIGAVADKIIIIAVAGAALTAAVAWIPGHLP